MPPAPANRYEPVVQRSFSTLVDDGCGGRGERVRTAARINRVYRDGVVLWNGADPATTYLVRFPGPTFGAKAKAVVGKSRYERAYETLREVKAERGRIDVALTCRGPGLPPVADRFSYIGDDGRERTFELGP